MTYSVKPKNTNKWMGRLAWWFILMGMLLCIIVWLGYLDELKRYKNLIEQSHKTVYYVKHSNDEVEKTIKDVEKFFFAVPWKGKFGMQHIDYFTAVANSIAEIIEFHGYKKNEYGVSISLAIEPSTKEHYIFLQVKLYKTGYKGQYYTEWYVSEFGSKAPKEFKLPDVPFREPRHDKPKPKDDFPNFKPEPKGKTTYL